MLRPCVQLAGSAPAGMRQRPFFQERPRRRRRPSGTSSALFSAARGDPTPTSVMLTDPEGAAGGQLKPGECPKRLPKRKADLGGRAPSRAIRRAHPQAEGDTVDAATVGTSDVPEVAEDLVGFEVFAMVSRRAASGCRDFGDVGATFGHDPCRWSRSRRCIGLDRIGCRNSAGQDG